MQPDESLGCARKMNHPSCQMNSDNASVIGQQENEVCHILNPINSIILIGVRRMVSALLLEGWIIGLFVIINGIYIVAFPPVNDEPQGYAIIAIGFFVILATLHLAGNSNKDRPFPPQ
jgi:hypothetical protein